ncbi:MAG: penicillin-binding protein 2, partial [Candidatus Saccharimonadales bacterium]|nr:penicillin-binding protein 2 [Candidatus Saccharimonadales bacterium]
MTDKGRRPISRTLALYLAVIFIGGAFFARLFSLQVVNGDYYRNQARSEQLKKFEIPATRGQIFMLDGSEVVPVVLNQNQPTLYADPEFVEDPALTAKKLAKAIGGESSDYLDLLVLDGNYVVLKKKLTAEEVEKIESLELPGIGMQDATYRVYPEGGLASQTIGFVNNDGEGQYGIEQYLNDELAGTPGLLNAVTDIRGIPLTTSDENALIDPEHGDDIVLTLDRQIQQYTQTALKKGVKASEAISGSAIVMDPNTGRIIAMANYPTYEQEKYNKVPADEASRFLNRVITDGYEAGSVVKPFTMAAALNEGAVTPSTEYYDAGKVKVGDREIENAGNSGGVDRTMTEVIQKSVNTGVVFALQQLGGGEINQKARNTLYDYFINRYGLGNVTGVAQSLEAPGQIFAPDHPEGNDVRYANMTFGQGMTVSMVQLTAAYSSLVNGGTYFKPYLIDQRVNSTTGEVAKAEPTSLRDNVITEKTSKQIVAMMEKVVELGGGISAKREGYRIGGKTGTSQVLEADGTYSEFREVGTFIGYGASGDKVDYVIMVRVDEPKIGGYAGT